MTSNSNFLAWLKNYRVVKGEMKAEEQIGAIWLTQEEFTAFYGCNVQDMIGGNVPRTLNSRSLPEQQPLPHPQQ